MHHHDEIERRIARLERLQPRTRQRRRPGRTAALGGLLLVAGLPLVAHTYPDAPHAFQAGDPISAADINDNFQHAVDGLTLLEDRVIPVGSVVAWAGGANPPPGWLLCDGTEYQSAAYPQLSAAIGSAHGGDGATTFFTPDLRGRFLRGVDMGTGRDPDSGSRTQPQEGSGNSADLVGSVQSHAFAAHTHGTAINFPNNAPGPGTFGSGSQGVFAEVMIALGVGNVDAQRSSMEGGSESRPVNVYMHFIMRAQ
ncbi:MAG: phage tail protein [Deltaproteobacteria bacterium]|nr:phage tail protein [Deltaproteobacteria bacterium]